MKNILLHRGEAFCSSVRLFVAFLFGGVLFPLYGMEDRAPYTGGEYTSPFKRFEFRGEVVGFSDTIAPGEYHKACTLLYIFRDHGTKRDALLKAMTSKSLWIKSSEQKASISVQKCCVAAFTASGSFNTIYFNLTSAQYADYCHYGDWRREQELLAALKESSASRSNKKPVFQHHWQPKGVQKRPSGITLWSFMRSTFSFFTNRPILSAGIALGGLWWYRTKYKNAAQ